MSRNKCHGRKRSAKVIVLTKFRPEFEEVFLKEKKAQLAAKNTLLEPTLDPVAAAFRHSLSEQVDTTSSRVTPQHSSPPSTPRSSNGSSKSNGTLVGSPSPLSTPTSPFFQSIRIAKKHREASDAAWESYARVLKDEEIEESWTMCLRWIQFALEAEKKDLRNKLEGQASDKDFAARHEAASERGWAAYKAYVQSQDDEAEWTIYIQWIQHVNEAEKAELQTEIFAAKMVEESLTIDVQNLQEDAQAEVDALKEERDEAEKRLERMSSSKNRINEVAKGLKTQKSQLNKDLEDWKQRTTEAMTVAENLRADLDKAQEKCEMLTANTPHAQTILSIIDKDHEIQQLQMASQGLENEKAQFQASLRFNWEKLNEKEAELQKLRKEMHLAANEVGFIHAQNMQYRIDTQDHPERSAHIDGLLKRKDEVYNDLLGKFNECAEQRAEETRGRDVDREHFAGALARLRKELGYKDNEIDGLKESRDRHQKQNGKICEMFKKKIFHQDMVDAMNAEHETLKQDNEYLTRMVNSKEVHALETMEKISPLNARIIELEHAVESNVPKQRDLEAEVNGLTTRKCELKVALQTMEGDFEGTIRDLRTELAEEKQKLQDFIRQGSSSAVQETLASKDREIEALRIERKAAGDNAWNWFNRVEELRADFDPVIWDNKIGNWDSEFREQRLRIAEKMLTDLEKKLKERGLWEEIRGDVDPRHRELDGVLEYLDGLRRDQ